MVRNVQICTERVCYSTKRGFRDDSGTVPVDRGDEHICIHHFSQYYLLKNIHVPRAEYGDGTVQGPQN